MGRQKSYEVTIMTGIATQRTAPHRLAQADGCLSIASSPGWQVPWRPCALCPEASPQPVGADPQFSEML